uniref:Uncharacterized protein n=1 Tax=viral metagenome TaxID=1070528 RepID=A0A6M3K114_9ZZZZ
MFDDIIYDKTISVGEYIQNPQCLKCRSFDVKEWGSGIFVNGHTFKQPIECKCCGYKWYVIFDNDLHIVDVVEGIV